MKDVLRSRWGWGWVFVAGLVLALPAAAQFSDTTDVVVVEVPVQVLAKDGTPVRGLTANDFEVYEGRKKLQVTGFEVLDLEVAPADMPVADMPTAARRHFLMLFDLSFAEPKSIIKARQAAADVVDSLHPTDLVAVATYAQSTGPQLVLGFTPDRRQAKLALDTLGLPQLVDRTPDPLRMVMSEARDAMQKAPGSEASAKRADTGEAVLEHLEGLYRESDRANQVVMQNKVKALTRSFADLARLMGGIQGRKHVVYLSEGFDSTILSGSVESEEQDDMAAAAASGEIWEVDSDKRFGNTSAMNVVEQMLESFRRADCAIQAVDIGGLRDSGDIQGTRARGKDALIQMAKGTGGEIYENFNDLSTAMDKMLQRTSVTYVLAVQPENVKFDGAYHKLKVELKNGKNGRVVHRPGYYGPKPVAQQNPLERLFTAASQVMGGEDSGPIATAAMAAPFYLAGSTTAYVPVVIEVDGPGLLAGKQGATLPAEVFVYAMDETGSVQDYLTQTLGLDLGKVQGQLQQSGMKFFGHLDLPPGRYSLRVLVRNGATGAYGLRVLPLDVPAFAEAVLLPPFFPEPAGKWLMVREQPRGQQKDVPYPFMLKDQPYIPASMPILGPGQEAQVSLVGYNLGAGDVQVRTQVVGADGKEMAPGELKVLAREAGAAGGPQRMLATFKAPNLQPGEYTLRVTLSTGGEAETSSARFVVKGG
ncbi:MAG TPA: VWA domain-containing protein [Thermoanaerobaculia bacterium]|nr:VWA domain-containing protein [Thermoanaerobaculia bacterium]